MPKVAKLGHVSIYAKDAQRLTEFYSDLFNLTVTARTPRASFLAIDPQTNHHDFAIASAPGTEHVAFYVDTLAEFRAFHAAVQARGIRILNCGLVMLGLRMDFHDPEGNIAEVLWRHGKWGRFPFFRQVDLATMTDADILRMVDEMPLEDQGVQIKANQRQTWNEAARGWHQWWEKIERGFGPLTDRMVTLAGLRPGHQVLDVATGIGEPAVTAAGVVGPEGRVVGIDLAPEMVGFAAQRAVTLGLTNAEFRTADAENLGLPQGSFDVVFCRLGLMFMPNLAACLAGIRSVLRPGGRFVAAVWSTPDKGPLVSLPGHMVSRFAGLPAPSPGAPGPFRLADAAALEGKFSAAGFCDVCSETVQVSVAFHSPAEFVRFQQDASTVIVKALEKETPERRAEAWQALADAVNVYADPEGRIVLPNEMIIVSARC